MPKWQRLKQITLGVDKNKTKKHAMMILKKISSALSKSTTYTIGRIQAKAYTILVKRTIEALKSLGITPKEWALLGLLYEKGTLRPRDVADELGVEAAYITAMGIHLKEMGLVDEQPHETDTRAKIMCLTSAGKRFVKKNESPLRASMSPLLRGASPRDIVGYIAILELIITNDLKLNTN